MAGSGSRRQLGGRCCKALAEGRQVQVVVEASPEVRDIKTLLRRTQVRLMRSLGYLVLLVERGFGLLRLK